MLDVQVQKGQMRVATSLSGPEREQLCHLLTKSVQNDLRVLKDAFK